jgi:hypothetical protein
MAIAGNEENKMTTSPPLLPITVELCTLFSAGQGFKKYYLSNILKQTKKLYTCLMSNF